MKLNLPLITGIAAAWGTLGLAAQAGDLTTMLLVPEGLELELGAPFEVVVEARLELSHRDLDQPLSTDVFANERKGRKELSALFDAPPLSEETLDYSWAILAAGSPSISFESSGLEDGSGVLVARSSWLLVSLEPGVRILPPMEWGEVTLESATELTVLGALEAGEDVPRPVAGFPDAPPLREAAGRPNVWIFVTPASLFLLLATLLLVRRGKEEEAIRRIDARHRMDTEMARLEALAAPESAASAEEIRTAHFALT